MPGPARRIAAGPLPAYPNPSPDGPHLPESHPVPRTVLALLLSPAALGAALAGGPVLDSMDELFAWDAVHLGPAGHEVMARTVLLAVARAGGR
jgi:hypothetical protein